MSAFKKILLGIFTFLPLVLFVFYLILFFSVFFENIHHLEHSHNDEFPIQFIRDIFLVFIPLIIAGTISLVITIYYIVHANNNENNDTTKKIMWTVILIFFNTLGSIVYYFIEIIPSNNLLKDSHLVNE